MPQENEFLIKIKTLLEDSGIKLTDEQFAKLADSLKNSGKAAHEAGIAHGEVHEAIKLLAIGAGDSLGPLGELAHFLGNPYLLAAAGATLAIKMLVEQHEKLHEMLIKNIEASQQIHDMFEDNLRKAFLDSAEALAKFHDTLDRVLDKQDRLSEKLKTDTALTHAQADAVKTLAAAEEALANARIATGQIEGVTNGPLANQMQHQAHLKARTEQQAAERDAAEQEIEMNRHAANHAEQESATAKDQADKLIKDRVTRDAAINDAKGEVDQGKEDLKEANKKLAELQAEPLARETPTPVRADETMYETRHREYVEAARAKVHEAQMEVDVLKGSIRGNENRVSQLGSEQDGVNAQISQLTSWAEHLKEVADQSRRAADEQERLQSNHNRTQDKTNATDEANAQITRRNALETKVRAGTATPDEQAEFSASQEHGVSQAIVGAGIMFRRIESNVLATEGGHASKEEVAQLVAIINRLIGLNENVYGVTETQSSAIAELQSRIDALKYRADINR